MKENNIFTRFFKSLSLTKPTLSVVSKNTHFNSSTNTWIAWLREDVPKPRVKYEIQTYLKGKLWIIKHTGNATMMVYQRLPFYRKIEFKFAMNQNNERMLMATYSCPSKPNDTQEFVTELFFDMGEHFAKKNFFLSQELNSQWERLNHEIVLESDFESWKNIDFTKFENIRVDLEANSLVVLLNEKIESKRVMKKMIRYSLKKCN